MGLLEKSHEFEEICVNLWCHLELGGTLGDNPLDYWFTGLDAGTGRICGTS